MNGEIDAFIVKMFCRIQNSRIVSKSIRSACRTNCMQDNFAISRRQQEGGNWQESPSCARLHPCANSRLASSAERELNELIGSFSKGSLVIFAAPSHHRWSQSHPPSSISWARSTPEWEWGARGTPSRHAPNWAWLWRARSKPLKHVPR